MATNYSLAVLTAGTVKSTATETAGGTTMTVKVSYNNTYLSLSTSSNPTPAGYTTGSSGQTSWVEWDLTVTGSEDFTVPYDVVQTGCSRVQGSVVTDTDTIVKSLTLCNY